MLITDALLGGDQHCIYVSADNSYDSSFPPPLNLDWERYGGIYRSSWTSIKEGAYIEYKGVRMVTELVMHHGNHPSIICWNIANEIMLTPKVTRSTGHAEPNSQRRKLWNVAPEEYVYIRRTISLLFEAIKTADPTRPVSNIIGGKWDLNEEQNITHMTDIVGYNGGTLNTRNYYDESTGKTYPLLMDYLQEKHPDRIALMTEGVVNAQECILSTNTVRAFWEKEYTAWITNAGFWDMFYKRDWFCGGSMWVFAEYYANASVRGMGVVDAHRLPLEVYYFYKAMWSNEPTMHILGHWDQDRSGIDTSDIVIFNNCDNVQLTLNGQVLQKGIAPSNNWTSIPNPPTIYKNIQYTPGTLTATGTFNGVTVESKLVTSGKPYKIDLSSSNSTIVADGQDISFITATVTDEKGNRCYTSYLDISIDIQGSGILKGESKLIARGGLNRFAIRSNGKKGPIKVFVTSDKLFTGSIELSAI